MAAHLLLRQAGRRLHALALHVLPGLQRLLLRQAGRRRLRVRRLVSRGLRVGRARRLRAGVAAAAVLPVLRLAGGRGVAVVLVRLQANEPVSMRGAIMSVVQQRTVHDERHHAGT